VRDGTILERGVQIERYCDLKNSVIGERTHIHSGFVGDSVIGKNCRIGAGFITANKRLDRSSIGATVKAKKVDSGRVSLGALIGDNVRIGVRVSTMPGAIVGSNSNIYPGAIVKRYFESGSDIAK
jgi:bifunctional UDP-N-acetylglucosamine pyrophosphorylase/glucosamine-1-phosphate N-acetyltransferase